MGEIEKVGDLESQNLSIKNIWEIPLLRNLVLVWSKFHRSGWKSLRLTNQYNRDIYIPQQSVFEMSNFDIVKAKKSCLSIV